MSDNADQSAPSTAGRKGGIQPSVYKKVDSVLENKHIVISFISNFFDGNHDTAVQSKEFTDILFDIYTQNLIEDNRSSFNSFRRNVLKLNKKLNDVMFMLHDQNDFLLSEIFEFEIAHHDLISQIKTERIGEIANFMVACRRLISITDAITNVRAPKMPNVSVQEACKALISFYEKQAKRKFTYNLYAPRGNNLGKKTPRDFKNRDANFVSQVLLRMDPDLKFESILTGLQGALREGRKQIGTKTGLNNY